MSEWFSSFREGLDRRARAIIAGTSVHGRGLRLTSQYNLLFASHLGATAFELGLLNDVAGAAAGLVG